MASPSRLGAYLIGLGVLWLLHYGPEVTLISKARPIYWITLVVDVFFAGLLILAGRGLRQGRDWAPKLALQAVGAIFVMSVVWGMLFAPLVLRELLAHPFSKVWNFIPRMLVYLLGIVGSPYAVRILIKGAPPESRKRLWMTLVSSGVLAVAVLAVVLIGFR